jgi:hypothetical protein
VNTKIRNPKSETIRLLSASLAIASIPLHAGTLATHFAEDPFTHGWESYGNTNLFHWDSTNEVVRVTWDSSQPNSYFAHPLPQALSRTNDFLLAFTLQLDDLTVGPDPGKPFSFQIAIGLMNQTQLTNTALARGSGYAPDLVEFDYFPNDVNNYGASVSTALISSAVNYWSGGFTFPLELATGAVYQVQMQFTAADQTLRSVMTSNGLPVGPLVDATIGGSFGDFAVDAVAVSSYSDQGQFPGYEGSILAHGSVDDILVASPLPVGLVSLPGAGEVAFASDPAWSYTLLSSTNLHTWAAAAPALPGNGGTLLLQDTNPPSQGALYRVQAVLP